jgi:hypothetical protein
MDTKRIAIVSATALLALTATASAGPMSIASSQTITLPTQIEQVYYHYRHHYRHYGWRHGYYRHYGWHRGWRRPYYGYGYGYPYYGYGLGTGVAALATAPLALAGAATAPPMTGRSVAASGDYCATPVKTCLLYHSSWVGNGCSCKVYDGYARGTVE